MVGLLRHIGFVLTLAVLSALLGRPMAEATIVDQPQFKIDGLVIVWGVSDPETGQSTDTAQIGRRMSISPAAALEPASFDVQIPVTGALSPLGGDDLIALRDTQMSFHVASNTAFSMDAELVGAGHMSRADLAATGFDLRASLGDGTGIGRSAQYPHEAGPRGGIAQSVTSLADLMGRTRVFTGTRPTAAKTGTITEQSVRFDIALERDGGSDKAWTPEIVFTVFVP